MKKFLALLLALCMIFALAACGEAESEPSEAPASEAPASEAPAEESPAAESDLAYVQDKGTLIVGITEFEPMDYQDESGEWIGFDADLAKAFAESGYSRLPVYHEDIDNIVGVIHEKDFHAARYHGQEDVSAIVSNVLYTTGSTKISDLLRILQRAKAHMVIVVDEYGGTSGLVSIEDLLEVIVGDIEDEHDAPREEDFRQVAESEYEISGRAYLEDLEPLGIMLESDEVDTLGGYLSLDAGHVPQQGEEFDLAGWRFIVTDADAKQIHKVHARRLTPEELREDTEDGE